MKNNRKIIAIDFDGVLNKYQGWKGEKVLYKPQNGAKDFIRKLYKNFDIVIYTCRDIKTVYDWLEENKLKDYIIAVSNLKPKAFAYIDDRAICFKGDFDATYKQIKDFKTWWEN